MSMLLSFGGKQYRPFLTKEGKLDARTAVAYGRAGMGMFRMSIYIMSVPAGAGKKGGVVDYQRLDVCAWREEVRNTISEAEQRQRIEFMLNVLATKLNCDYTLRFPIQTRHTPAYSRPKKEKTVPMGVIFDEYEEQLRKEMEDGIQRP